jgi:cephalosporin hydroxylase
MELWKRFRKKAKGLKALLYRRLLIRQRLQHDIVGDFHKLFYYSGFLKGTWMDTHWLGVPVKKCPFDLWVFQELLAELRPDVVVESGTALGGSALFMAGVCDLLGHGRIITIDIEEQDGRPTHPRIQYLLGSSTSPEIVAQVKGLVGDAHTVLVVLDSDHSKEHVSRELALYSELVTVGSYIIVEDTNIHGHPVLPNHPPGPMEAVEEFLSRNTHFTPDRSREKFYVTHNPKGYLQRTR